jgi:hypothetical protein
MATILQTTYDGLHWLQKNYRSVEPVDRVRRLVSLSAKFARAARRAGEEKIEQRAETFRRATRKGGRVYQVFVDARCDLFEFGGCPSNLGKLAARTPTEVPWISSNVKFEIEDAARAESMEKPATTTVESDRKGCWFISEDAIHALQHFLSKALPDTDIRSSPWNDYHLPLQGFADGLGEASILTQCKPWEL